jgi:hypothetical protein
MKFQNRVNFLNNFTSLDNNQEGITNAIFNKGKIKTISKHEAINMIKQNALIYNYINSEFQDDIEFSYNCFLENQSCISFMKTQVKWGVWLSNLIKILDNRNFYEIGVRHFKNKIEEINDIPDSSVSILNLKLEIFVKLNLALQNEGFEDIPFSNFKINNEAFNFVEIASFLAKKRYIKYLENSIDFLKLTNLKAILILLEYDINFHKKLHIKYQYEPELINWIYRNNSTYFKLLSKYVGGNKTMLKELLAKSNLNILEFMSDSLKTDNLFCNFVLKNYPKGLIYFDANAFNIEDCLKLISQNLTNYSFLPYEIKCVKEIAIHFVKISNLKDSHFPDWHKYIPVKLFENKEFLLNLFEVNPKDLNDEKVLNMLPQWLWNDETIKKNAINLGINPFKYNKQEIYDKSTILNNIDWYEYACSELKNDANLVWEYIKKSPHGYYKLPEKYQKDENIIIELMKSQISMPYKMKWIHKDMKNNKSLALKLLPFGEPVYYILYFFDKEIFDDDFCLELLEYNSNLIGIILQMRKNKPDYFSDHIFEKMLLINPKVITLYNLKFREKYYVSHLNSGNAQDSIKPQGCYLETTYDEELIKTNKEFKNYEWILKQLSLNGLALKYLPLACQNNIIFILTALNQNPKNENFFKLKWGNYQIPLSIIQNNFPAEYQKAQNELKIMKKLSFDLMSLVVDYILANFPNNFQLLPDEFKNHKETVLKAVNIDGYLYNYISPILRSDLEVVRAAISQNSSVKDLVPKYLNSKICP